MTACTWLQEWAILTTSIWLPGASHTDWPYLWSVWHPLNPQLDLQGSCKRKRDKKERKKEYEGNR